MGCEWDFALHLPRETSIDEILDVALQSCSTVGYEAGYERFGKMHLSLQGGDRWVASACELHDALRNEPGWCFRLVKREHISLSFNRDGCVLSLASGQTLVPSLADFALDLESIFRSMICRLAPHYAYSADEWTVEFIWDGDFCEQWAAFQRTIERRETPPVLWWLNYFSEAYYPQVANRLGPLQDVRVEDLGGGQLVKFSSPAWDVPCAKLAPDGLYRV